jgi:hypothetical protein
VVINYVANSCSYVAYCELMMIFEELLTQGGSFGGESWVWPQFIYPELKLGAMRQIIEWVRIATGFILGIK